MIKGVATILLQLKLTNKEADQAKKFKVEYLRYKFREASRACLGL